MREKKNNKLVLYKTTVTMYIYMVTVAISETNSIMEELMRVDFEQKCVK